MLIVGRQKLANLGYYDRLLLGDVRRLPFDDNSFDYILLSGVLGLFSWRDQRLALREMLRVCARGLRLLEPVFEHSRPLLRWLLLRYVWHMRPIPIEQFNDLQLSYRTGLSTRAGLFSYIQVDKR